MKLAIRSLLVTVGVDTAFLLLASYILAHVKGHFGSVWTNGDQFATLATFGFTMVILSIGTFVLGLSVSSRGNEMSYGRRYSTNLDGSDGKGYKNRNCRVWNPVHQRYVTVHIPDDNGICKECHKKVRVPKP